MLYEKLLKSVESEAERRWEIRDATNLASLRPAWENLCGRMVEDNVYYSPSYVLALVETIADPRRLRVLLAWEGETLIGLFPVVIRAGLIGSAWRTPYTFGCAPLLDRERDVVAAGLLVDAMAATRVREWIIPALCVEGAATRALIAALAARGSPFLRRGRFARASLAPGATFREHVERHVANKRRKELERNRRRLAELGDLRHVVALEGAERDEALSAFLALEASGWKGRQGTALACRPETDAFARLAFGSAAGPGACRVDMLVLDGRPIAVGLTAFCGRTGFTVKCCYDESLRSRAPGLVLELEVLRAFLEAPFADRLDAATAGAHVVDDLWGDATEVAEIVLSLAPTAGERRLALLAKGLDLAAGAKAVAKRSVKSLIGRVRAIRGSGRGRT